MSRASHPTQLRSTGNDLAAGCSSLILGALVLLALRERGTNTPQRVAKRAPLSYLIFGAMGAFGFFIGGRDALVAWYTAQLLGITLVGLGIVALTGVVLVFTARPSLAFLRWASPAAAALMAGLMLYSQLSAARVSPEVPDRFWVLTALWVGVIATAAGHLFLTWRRHAFELPKTRLARRFSAAVTLGAFVGAVNFWYTSSFVPFKASPALSIETDLQQQAVKGDMVAIGATVTVRNTSETKVVVVGSKYRILGLKVAPPTGPVTVRSRLAPDGQTPRPGGRVSPLSDDQKSSLIQTDRLLPANISFDRNQVHKATLVVVVPKDAFDLVRVNTVVVVAKDRVLQLDQTQNEDPWRYQPDPPDGHEYLAIPTPIAETSWISSFTGLDNWVIESWRLDDDGTSLSDAHSANLEVYIMSQKHAASHSGLPSKLHLVPTSTTTFYGLNTSPTESELSLWDRPAK
jgi:hypothetical protein